MLGYEFKNQGSELNKRATAEKASFENLRHRLDATTTKLIGEVEGFKTEFAAWTHEKTKGWESWLDQSGREQQKQQSTQKSEYIKFMDGCNTRMQALEKTYQEKLRLEKPAEYWKRRRKNTEYMAVFGL